MARSHFHHLLALGLGVALSVGPSGRTHADDYAALRSDAQIENGVLIVAIGDLIQDACPGFEDRRVRSVPFLLELAGRARDLGYSDDEIRAYISDDVEKARVEARAVQWFAQQGASPDTPESICEVARAEIAANSAVGRLIRER